MTTTVPTTVRIEPINPTIGAHITGIDLKDPLAPDQIAQLRQAVVDHKVVFLHSGILDETELRSVSRYFGEPLDHRGVPHIPATPWVNLIQDNYLAGGVHFHFGGPWRPDPFVFEILQMRIVPERGGDTIWADQQAAYDALSEPLQTLLAGLRGAYVGDGARFGDRSVPLTDENRVEHPLVITHPETGRRGIYLTSSIREVVGLKPAEAAVLLPFLFAHQSAHQFVVRHRWQPGDVAIWDNRAVIHAGVGDYGDSPRLGWHTMIVNEWEPR